MLRPLLRFFLLGAAGFLVVHTLLPGIGPDASESIQISAGDVDRLRASWIAKHALPPSDGQLAVLIDRAIDEEVLHREALRLGLHRIDPVVERHLVRNMRFVTGESAVGGGGDLFREALELDMARTDLVVRRRLVERMGAVLAASAPEPTADESRAYVRRHPERFSSSNKFRLSYRFERSGRGAGTGAVRSGLFTERRLTRLFGERVASELMRLEPGHWRGPFVRDDGALHARLDETIRGELPAFELIEAHARLSLMRERRSRAVAQALRALRRRYAIEVSGRSPG